MVCEMYKVDQGEAEKSDKTGEGIIIRQDGWEQGYLIR